MRNGIWDVRRLLSVVAIVWIALASVQDAHAGPGGCTNAGSLVAFDDEVLTVSSTSKALTATKYAATGDIPADMAVCMVETDSVRFRVNGLDPTAAVGTLVIATATAPAPITVCGTSNIRKVRFIRVTTDASLTCVYYRQGDQ